jgi:hypothetical protein
MRLRNALRHAAAAARENLLPGLLLQACMLVFLGLYLWNEPTRAFLEQVARIKVAWGYGFAVVSYTVAAALMPELLRVVFFQRGRPHWRNVTNFLGAAPIWAFIGVTVDMLYRGQAMWFGTGSDFRTIVCKLLVDQFVYSPFFSVPIIVSWLWWRDWGYSRAAARAIFTMDFVFEHIFPVMVAGWCVWIPGVSLVYFMPSPLQLPTAVTIQVFWVLIITTLSEKKSAPPSADTPPGVV